MRPTKTEIDEAAVRLAGAPASEVMRWALGRFGRRLAIASSFSIEDCVVIDVAHKVAADVRVFALDTGRLPEETYQTADRVRARIRGRSDVSRSELADLVREILGDEALGPAPISLPPDVWVIKDEGGRANPFSKGILSQSLLAAALDPQDAFDVAREIEREIVRRRLHEITRRDLRRLTYETLGARQGPKTASTRFWRRMASAKVIMIAYSSGRSTLPV